MINVGIFGATGYVGEELIDILLGHPQVRITYLAAKLDKSTAITKIFPQFKNRIDLVCEIPDYKKAISVCNLIFLALPHSVSMRVVPFLLKAGKRVIDLSADYRLKDAKIYERCYQAKHKDVENIKAAVYGLPEIYRGRIKKANLCANPGCYPTAAILGLAPLLTCESIMLETIIIDAKSGATGAGRKAVLDYQFCEVNEDVRAYKINTHQHIPEINQELSKLAEHSIKVNFVPHLLSINRGILETIYVRLNSKLLPRRQAGKAQNSKLLNLYKRFYKEEPFVRIKEEGELPSLKDVVGGNFCDIAIHSFAENNLILKDRPSYPLRKGLIIIIVAIDNLLKGAAGQAVQNMNIMYGFPETAGLL